ncbi:MAG: BON domain-containing protein [Rubripirellula sp.]
MSTISSQDHSNAEVALLLKEELCHSGHNVLQRVEVEVDNHSIVLSGTVPSYFLKQVAQETVLAACHDRHLSNDIRVKAK